jgi:hypothetical protein
MTEPTLLPVKPGSLSKEDKAALREVGVIVIEHDNPETLRLLKPWAEVDSNQMLMCAMNALCDETVGSQGARSFFTKLLHKVMLERLNTEAKGPRSGPA